MIKSMSNNLEFSCELQINRLIFNIKNSLRQYKCQIDFQEAHSSLFKIFNNIQELYRYVNQENVLELDEINMELRIRIQTLGKNRYIYLKLESEQMQHYLNICFNQLLAEYERVCSDIVDQNQRFERQINQIEHLCLQKILQKNQNYREKKMMQNNIQKLQKHLTDLTEQIMNVENELLSQDKQFNSEQNMTRQSLLQNDNMRQRSKLCLYYLTQIENQRVRQLLNQPQEFKNLKQLNLQNCNLTRMEFVSLFSALQYINLSHNEIKIIIGLSKLFNLKQLNLSNNKIKVIQGIQFNISLKAINLSKNQIQKIDNIFHLINLQFLSLSSNNILKIPDEIQNLINLRELRLINNKIRLISPKINSLQNLKICSLLGNKCFSDQNKCKQVINDMVKRQIETVGSEF